MRIRLALATTVLGALLAIVPSTAGAATYADTMAGIELPPTSTQGTFTGVAAGSLPGTWVATVVHTPLSPNATITGGSFALTTVVDSTPTLVTGTFVPGGTVTQVSGFTGCTNQRFAIDGALANVGPWYTGSGSGTFTGVLTHYRASIFGSCVTYFATITAGLSVDF